MEAYKVKTHKYSYYQLDDKGYPVLDINGVQQQGEGWIRLSREIVPASSALVVMDAWVDSPDKFISTRTDKILLKQIVPIAKKCADIGMHVFAFTNSPRVIGYTQRVHGQFYDMENNGTAHVLYHQDVDTQLFASMLQMMRISTLVYCGFMSNGCLLSRDTGIVAMSQFTRSMYFISDASMAIEHKYGWDVGTAHEEATRSISMWWAEIIDTKDFIGMKK